MAVSKVVIGGNTVGLIDLEEVFQEAREAGLKDHEHLKDFIVERVKVKNYVPSRLEPTYREDLLEEFLVLTGELPERKQTSSTVEIRLYGASCSRCEQLDVMVKNILSRHGLRVDYQYIADTGEIARLGVMAFPALAVAGKLVLSGQVPTERHLEETLLAAIGSSAVKA